MRKEMNTVDKLEFLSAEINRAKALIKETYQELKTAIAEAKNSSEKKEEYEFLKTSIANRLLAVERRLEVLEDTRLGIVLNEVTDDPFLENREPAPVVPTTTDKKKKKVETESEFAKAAF